MDIYASPGIPSSDPDRARICHLLFLQCRVLTPSSPASRPPIAPPGWRPCSTTPASSRRCPERLEEEKERGDHRVHECQTPVFLWVEVEDGKVHIHADVPPGVPHGTGVHLPAGPRARGRGAGGGGQDPRRPPRPARPERDARHDPHPGTHRHPAPDQALRGRSRLMLGVLELAGRGAGFLRRREAGYLPSNGDVHVGERIIRQYGLRAGDEIDGETRPGGKGRGADAREGHRRPRQPPRASSAAAPSSPASAPSIPTSSSGSRRGSSAQGQPDSTNRVIDLLCPLGKGQRALIVAPAKAGKTMVLQAIAQGVSANYPEADAAHPAGGRAARGSVRDGGGGRRRGDRLELRQPGAAARGGGGADARACPPPGGAGRGRGADRGFADPPGAGLQHGGEGHRPDAVGRARRPVAGEAQALSRAARGRSTRPRAAGRSPSSPRRWWTRAARWTR